jgi:hypothetical protein
VYRSVNLSYIISIEADAPQMRALTRSYEVLIKDKEIIAAEVMHEYNEGVRHSFQALSIFTDALGSLSTRV